MNDEKLANLSAVVNAVFNNQTTAVAQSLVLETAFVLLASKLAKSSDDPNGEVSRFIEELNTTTENSLQSLGVNDDQMRFQVETAADRLSQMLRRGIAMDLPRSASN